VFFLLRAENPRLFAGSTRVNFGPGMTPIAAQTRLLGRAVAVLNREFGPEINKYAFTDKKLLKEAVFAALAFVTDNSEDYDHRWINLHGMAAFTTEAGTVQSTPLSLPKAEWAKIKAKTIADYKEGFEDAYKQIP
jgi:hypothetical protein